MSAGRGFPRGKAGIGRQRDFLNKTVLEALTSYTGIPMMLAGLVVLAYTQFLYMYASLGCGPRDTLLVGLARRMKKIPIGAVSIALLSVATLTGKLLGGPVGVGTLICAFGAGPVMQLAFRTIRFDATAIDHQRIRDSVRVFLRSVKIINENE